MPLRGSATHAIVVLREVARVAVVTVPIHIRERLGWEEGDMIIQDVVGDTLVLRREDPRARHTK